MASVEPENSFLYRIDIYISLADQAGKPVDSKKLNQLRNEIVRHFGGLTTTSIFGNPVYDGFWQSPKTKKIVRDKNSIFTVLAPQTDDTRQYFVARREAWRISLNYEKLLVTVHELQVL